MGLDVGSKTVGIAESDPLGWTAQGIEIIPIDEDEKVFGLDRVAELMKGRQIAGFVVGLPKNMNNTEGPRVEAARRYGAMLEERFGLPVDYQDERLTTVQAHRMLVEEADISRRKQKKVIDELAASLILQNYLDRKGKLTARLWGRKMAEEIKPIQDDGEVFTLVDEKGNEELYKEAMRFQNPETGKWYICLYPLDQENDDEVDIQAFAFNEPADDSEELQLLPIESDEEWDMVQEVMNTFIDDEGNLNL